MRNAQQTRQFLISIIERFTKAENKDPKYKGEYRLLKAGLVDVLSNLNEWETDFKNLEERIMTLVERLRIINEKVTQLTVAKPEITPEVEAELAKLETALGIIEIIPIPDPS